MSLVLASKSRVMQQRLIFLSSNKFVVSLCKSLTISGLVLYLIYIILSSHPCCWSPTLLASLKYQGSSSSISVSPTNISHLVFGIASSANTWIKKRAYIESWWQPNTTHGYIFLDRVPKESQQWPSSFPPFRVSEDTSRYKEYNKHPNPQATRMARIILETFREENKGVRWYIMADDDTIFFFG